jgi:hypothetical protein
MVHRLKVNWAGGKTQRTGAVFLSDPGRKIPFAIQNEATTERFLTGADLDPESIQVVNDEWWIGDEFGPYVVRFDARGHALGLTMVEWPLWDAATKAPEAHAGNVAADGFVKNR